MKNAKKRKLGFTLGAIAIIAGMVGVSTPAQAAPTVAVMYEIPILTKQGCEDSVKVKLPNNGYNPKITHNLGDDLVAYDGDTVTVTATLPPGTQWSTKNSGGWKRINSQTLRWSETVYAPYRCGETVMPGSPITSDAWKDPSTGKVYAPTVWLPRAEPNISYELVGTPTNGGTVWVVATYTGESEEFWWWVAEGVWFDNGDGTAVWEHTFSYVQ